MQNAPSQGTAKGDTCMLDNSSKRKPLYRTAVASVQSFAVLTH